MQRLAITAITALVLLNGDRVDAGDKSNAVKATATATKIDKDRKQVVMVTLEIQKGWAIYANPVNFWAFEDNQTTVRFKAKQGVTAEVKYPAGNTHASKIKLQMYEGRTVIEAVVKQAARRHQPFTNRHRVCAR